MASRPDVGGEKKWEREWRGRGEWEVGNYKQRWRVNGEETIEAMDIGMPEEGVTQRWKAGREMKGEREETWDVMARVKTEEWKEDGQGIKAEPERKVAVSRTRRTKCRERNVVSGKMK